MAWLLGWSLVAETSAGRHRSSSRGAEAHVRSALESVIDYYLVRLRNAEPYDRRLVAQRGHARGKASRRCGVDALCSPDALISRPPSRARPISSDGFWRRGSRTVDHCGMKTSETSQLSAFVRLGRFRRRPRRSGQGAQISARRQSRTKKFPTRVLSRQNRRVVWILVSSPRPSPFPDGAPLPDPCGHTSNVFPGASRS